MKALKYFSVVLCLAIGAFYLNAQIAQDTVVKQSQLENGHAGQTLDDAMHGADGHSHIGHPNDGHSHEGHKEDGHSHDWH